MQPFDDECEFEDPKNFSEERVQHLLNGLQPGDSAYEPRMRWTTNVDNWMLRNITPVVDGYSEELYRRLSEIA